jgi:hypothetical protein
MFTRTRPSGDAYLALKVITPGHNKPKHIKSEHTAKPAKEHGKRH